MINCRIFIFATPKSRKGDFRYLQECTKCGTPTPFRGLEVKMRQYIAPITYNSVKILNAI